MTSLTGSSMGCIRNTMDRTLADKFSCIIKEIWRIRTDIDRLVHNVIELTALTDEEIRKADTQDNGTGKEEVDKMGRQDS